MTGNELREAFLKFFSDKDHLILPSAPLVPEEDPTLLWINAGMAPFKPYFNGKLTPPHTRIATSQRCLRTNDIENVGQTKRHHTFFEMLGNFSFGDYFKEEAISWAWEFVTEVLRLDKKRLWVTIYKNDDRSFEIWKDFIGLKKDKIIRMGKEENYWQIGTGPCGPCSEIHYDREPEAGSDPALELQEDGPRFLEIWNLVFTQYDYTDQGEYKPLPSKNIDTGMGLERVASIMQDTPSNFETDLIKPIIDELVSYCKIDYRKNKEFTTAYRVIADHIRAVTMAIFDGVIPANEGRGYVIRRLVRRAVRFGGKLGCGEPFLYRLIPVVNDIMSEGYPEVREQEEHIQEVVKSEEENFQETLSQGLSILEDMISEMKAQDQNVLSGSKAFKLYDTFGFPLELTEEILAEEGMTVDEKEFQQAMKKQKERARQARQENGFGRDASQKLYTRLRNENGNVEFTGYHNLEIETEIRNLISLPSSEEAGVSKKGDAAGGEEEHCSAKSSAGKESSESAAVEEKSELTRGEQGEVLLSRTPFYAEGGGQVGDTGEITTDTGRAEVIDTYSRSELTLSRVKVSEGSIKKGQLARAEVDRKKRKAVARNHTSTHLLHRALNEVLGEHIKQSGSLVAPDKLRFDFAHHSAPGAEEIKKIERIVNSRIRKDYSVQAIQTTIDNARDMGAVALFDEKYGSQVRVIKIGDYSLELCGGTHVEATGEIGLFKITGESSVAAGTRRIEAVTGERAVDYVEDKEKLLTRLSDMLNSEPDKLINRLSQLQEEKKELEKEITSLKDRLAVFRSQALIETIEQVEKIPLLTAELQDLDAEALRTLGDQLKMKIESGIIILASSHQKKVLFLAMVTEDLVEKGFHAGEIIGEAARITGGGGGGRPDMAQAGGTDPDKIDQALNRVKEIIKEKMSVKEE